jgi:hypothetical protein
MATKKQSTKSPSTPSEILNSYGALFCKDIVSKEMSNFLTHVLLRKYGVDGREGDEQIPNALSLIDHDLFLETLQEQIWPKLEYILGEELLPTYSYSRLYSNGDILEKHTDRPACEISITVQLGRSHNYAWPIYMGDYRYDLVEGDGVIYRGCDVAHWRNPCDGPDNYYSGQVFFHFVRKNGKNAKQFCDPSNRKVNPKTFFVKNRTHLMNLK